MSDLAPAAASRPAEISSLEQRPWPRAAGVVVRMLGMRRSVGTVPEPVRAVPIPMSRPHDVFGNTLWGCFLPVVRLPTTHVYRGVHLPQGGIRVFCPWVQPRRGPTAAARGVKAPGTTDVPRGCAVPGWNRESILWKRRVAEKAGVLLRPWLVGSLCDLLPASAGLKSSKTGRATHTIRGGKVRRTSHGFNVAVEKVVAGTRATDRRKTRDWWGWRPSSRRADAQVGYGSSLRGLTGIGHRDLPDASRPGAGEASRQLENCLGMKSVPALRAGAEVEGSTRLRSRARWVLRLTTLLGLPPGALGAFLRGRWTPDLPSSALPGTRELGELVQGGAKFLGGGTSASQPGGEDDRDYTVPWAAFWLGGDVLRVYPELVGRLSSYACFRERDPSLLASLRLRAIEWCKERRLPDLEVALMVPGSVAVAAARSRPEAAAERLMGGEDDGMCPPREVAIAKAGNGWIGRLGSGISDYLGSRPGWWRKGGAA